MEKKYNLHKKYFEGHFNQKKWDTIGHVCFPFNYKNVCIADKQAMTLFGHSWMRFIRLQCISYGKCLGALQMCNIVHLPFTQSLSNKKMYRGAYMGMHRSIVLNVNLTYWGNGGFNFCRIHLKIKKDHLLYLVRLVRKRLDLNVAIR